MTGRLLLLAMSPRVAPGLLSWSAWAALREADEVYVAAGDHRCAAALAEAGVIVVVRDADTVQERADFLRGRAEQASVVWLAGADGDPELADRLGPAPLSQGLAAPVAAMTGSWDLPGGRLLDLVAVMDRLRSPGGCPWDAAQTHVSLLPYLLEEAYETVEVIETEDLVGLREELGDLLLQVVFHARLAQEHQSAPWSIDDVADGIVTKLVTRHPHVFAGADASDPGALELSWEVLKRAEKGRTSAVDGVPLAQPALALATKLIGRATRAGLDVQAPVGVEDEAAPSGSGFTDPMGVDECGELLMALAARAHAAGVDPEAALRTAARRYAGKVREAEAAAAQVTAQDGAGPATAGGASEITSAP